MEVGGVWRSKRVIKKTAEVHRIFLKEESRAQIKKVNLCHQYLLLLLLLNVRLRCMEPKLAVHLPSSHGSTKLHKILHRTTKDLHDKTDDSRCDHSVVHSSPVLNLVWQCYAYSQYRQHNRNVSKNILYLGHGSVVKFYTTLFHHLGISV